MNSFTQLVQNVKDANWQSAGQVFKEIMQQKVADRLDIERRTIFKEDSSEAYKKYFNSMLKKWNVSSPDDIPDDKKDDFFKAVDKGYKAKNEDCGLKHEDENDDEEQVDENGRPAWKYQTGDDDGKDDGPHVWDYQKEVAKPHVPKPGVTKIKPDLKGRLGAVRNV